MGSCNCGGKTVKFTPAKLKPAKLSPAPIKSGGKPEQVSARSRRLSAKATKKAKAAAVPCNCTP